LTFFDVIFSCFRFVERPNRPLAAAEPFVNGKYVKHNNNAGYVENDLHRSTPQAFSHFTYQASAER
jgi:elongation factor 2 kinase